MAEMRVLRTYRYVDKNPVIDKMRTVLQDEGLFKKLPIVHELSGISTSCLHALFHGATRNPQHRTVAGVMTSLGYEETFQKIKDIDIERERKAAADWLEKQDAGKDKRKKQKRRVNGHAKKGK
jgi:hypothetical protein